MSLTYATRRALLTLSPNKGVPEFTTINGLYVRRLRGATGLYLTGATGLPLYGRTS